MTVQPEAAVTPEATEPVDFDGRPTDAAVFDLDSLDTDREFLESYINKLSETHREFASIVEALKSAQGDEAAVVESIKNSDSDPKVVKANEVITDLDRRLSEAQAALDAYAKEQAKSRMTVDHEKVAELTLRANTLEKKIKTGRNYLVSEAEGNEAILSLLPDVPGRKARANVATGNGEGVRRLRGFNIYIDGELATQAQTKNGQKVLVSSFTAGALKMNADTKALQAAYYEVAGTKDAKAFPESVNFEFKVGDKTHQVRADRLTPEQTP